VAIAAVNRGFCRAGIVAGPRRLTLDLPTTKGRMFWRNSRRRDPRTAAAFILLNANRTS
jgi:hypothetical protein